MDNTKDFSNLAYAKLNLEFDAELFCYEYDKYILPHGLSICNSALSLNNGIKLNKLWGMVPPNEYNKADIWTQEGNAQSLNYIKRERPQWKMVQLMELDVTNITDPLMIRYSKQGGPSIRNATLDPQYKFSIKPHFSHLKIWEWIQEKLPMEEIKSLHCVSIEAGGLATIHRDSKGFYDSGSSAGKNQVYKNGYVIININISNGGGPLWWCLDGPGVLNPLQSDDQVYLTNDYFLHAVPIMTSRRRQLRVMGRPKPELWNLLEQKGMIELPEDYEYDDTFGLSYLFPENA
jgi:hypothetical protein